MSYELFFIDDEFGTVTEYHGVLTDELLIKCTKERYSSVERNKRLQYILNDYSKCSKIDINSDTVKYVATLAIDVSKLNKNIVIAGVMPTDLEFGLGRMWQAYADETEWVSKTIRTRDEAENWIQQTLKQKLHFNHKKI